MLESLLAQYTDEGYTAADRPESEFMYWVRRYGAVRHGGAAARPRHPVDSDANPFVWVDLNKCILCTRCVRACDEVQGRFVWHLAERGATRCR